MILGISSFTYGWSVGVPGKMPEKPMDEIDLVNKTIGFGLKCLQIGDNLPLHKLSPKRLEQLKTLVLEKKIRLEVGARGLTPDHFSKYIELASYFDSPLLRFVVDEQNYEPDDEIIVQLVRDALRILKDKNIVLGIENHDRLKAKQLAKIMEAVGDDHVGICLDCANSLGAGEGLDYVSTVLAPYTVNLHIKDFTIQRYYHKMGFTVNGTPAGKGMTNVPMLLEKLAQFGRCKSAILELWPEPEDQISATVEKEQLWAEQSITYLKQIKIFK